MRGTSWNNALHTLIIVHTSIQLLSCISTDHHLDCSNERRKVNITSPNFPNRYNNNEDTTWIVDANAPSRLIVSFESFHLQSGDRLIFIDRGGKETIYTGEMPFTPYLSLSNRVSLRFLSDYSGTRTGFNLTLECYRPRDDTFSLDLVGGPAPDEGWLIIGNSTHTFQLCSGNLPLANTVCHQLGFPGARRIDSRECQEAGCDEQWQNDTLVVETVTCLEYSFRFQDCTFQLSNPCDVWRKQFISCQKPGYIGCFKIDIEFPNGKPLDTVAACISYCESRREETSLLAIYTGQSTCHCVRESDIDLRDFSQLCQPEKKDENARSGSISDCHNCSQSVVFKVPAGLCGEPDDVTDGKWFENDTRYGSIITAQCDAGYELEDNTTSTLQCLEGEGSVYSPVWNGTAPLCRPIPNDDIKQQLAPWAVVLIIIPIILVVIVIVAVVVFKRALSEKLPSQESGHQRSLDREEDDQERHQEQVTIEQEAPDRENPGEIQSML